MFTKIKVAVLRWFYRFLNNRAWSNRRDAPAPGNVSTIQMDTAEGQLALRMYASTQGASRPLIVYFHGGGWVIGDLDTHDPFCRELCARSGATVVSVDYRLAPEHQFPAAHDDCLAATSWIGEKLSELGPNNGTWFWLATVLVQIWPPVPACNSGEKERAWVAGEIVIYPVADYYNTPYDSYVEKGKGHPLTSNLMRWFWDTYVGKPSQDTALRASPMRARNLASLPPTLLVTAENDPLRDEGIAYGEKLCEANVPLQYHHFGSEAHGFACSDGMTDSFELLITRLCTWIDQLVCENGGSNTPPG